MKNGLGKFFALWKKKLTLVVVISLLCAVGSFFFSNYVLEPGYTCRIKFRISLSSDRITQPISDAPAWNPTLDVTERIQSDAFCRLVSEKTEGAFAPETVCKAIEFIPVEHTTVFWIRVCASTAKNALVLGEAVQAAAPEVIRANGEIYAIEPLIAPRLPMAPGEPNVLQNTLWGLAAGFLFSSALGIAVGFWDQRIKSTADIAQRYALPILGVVPSFEGSGKKGRKGKR